MMRVRILLADDHEVVLEGLQLFLAEAGPSLEVVGRASDGEDALAQLVALRPDIALVDVSMPRLDGIEVARRARDLLLPTHIVLLTTFITERAVRDAVDAGVMGFLLKDMGRTELLTAITTVAHGRPAFHPLAQEHLLRQVRPVSASPLDALTDRERDVLTLIARGASNKAIARSLDLTVGTVKGYVSAIFEKLGVSSRTQAALIAVQHGMEEQPNPQQ